jgi:hypothetical protein
MIEPKQYDAISDDLSRVMQEKEQYKKDAQRYVWLRDNSEPGICAFYLSVGKAFHNIRFTSEQIDDAIDSAINNRALPLPDAEKEQ